MEKYYSTEDVAEILGFKEKTVREWLRTGKLKGKKVGRVWRIKESDLEEFINNTENYLAGSKEKMNR
ncbi:MAG: helix-turn-helix domain-containing protein [Thermosediminibacteraceae bacterium]|nr:helix-turn-helix domain-containing protein [Thermosediminibacteraceae bacterium]